MSLLRSRSTPHVNRQEPFLSQSARSARPHIPRHRSAFALSESPSAASSSARHTPPHSERVEDPFSLTGFFSPGLSVSDQPSGSTWNWLRGDEEDSGTDTELRYMASGCVSPISEEDAEPFTEENTALIFDKLRDKLADAAIREEDKFGVLSLPGGVFVADGADDASAHDCWLARYCDGDPEDDNALYEALHALRQAHMPADAAKAVGINMGRGLFSPVDSNDEEDDPAGQSRWQSLLWQGFGTVLDIVSV